MNMLPFRMNDETRELIIECSALNGQAQNVIKEVFEHLLLNWIIKIADNPDGYAVLEIPYLGRIGIKYDSDRFLPSGEVTTDVSSYIELSDNFKKLVGDLHDEAENVVTEAIRRKIETAGMIASED